MANKTIGKWSRKSSFVPGTGDKNTVPPGQLKWHLVWKVVHLECVPPIPMASFPLGIHPSWLLWSAEKHRIKAVRRTDVVPLKKPAAFFSDRQLPSTEQHFRKTGPLLPLDGCLCINNVLIYINLCFGVFSICVLLYFWGKKILPCMDLEDFSKRPLWFSSSEFWHLT